MNLIAVIVCVPAAVAAAIFLGIFFGRRNAKKKGKKTDDDNKDDLPLTPIDNGKVRVANYYEMPAVLILLYSMRRSIQFNELMTPNTVLSRWMRQRRGWPALISCTSPMPTSNL